jgi:hypothetical protein
MTRAARIEGITQIAILLVMGVMAAAASFKHIHDLAVANGQPSWIGWVDAVVVELMSIVAGLESRRRKRTGQPTRFVHFVLYGAALVSLAAQVAKAAPSVWGWIMAALPAAGFLAVVKIVLARTPIETRPDQNPVGETGPVRNLDQPDDDGRTNSPSTGPTQHGVGTTTGPADENRGALPRSDRTKTPTGRAGDSKSHTSSGADRTGRKRAELLTLARAQAARLQETEGKVTRDGLAAAIRKTGHSVSTDIASELLRLIQAEAQPVGAG